MQAYLAWYLYYFLLLFYAWIKGESMYNVFCRQANLVESEAIAFSVFKVSK